MVSFVKPSLLGTRREFGNRFINPITNGQHADSTSRDVKIMKRRAHVLHEMLAGCVQVTYPFFFELIGYLTIEWMSTWKTLLFVSRISLSISAGRKYITLHTFNSWYCFIYQRKDYSVITKLLPPKHEYVISVRLSKIQMELYEKYLQLNVTHDPNNPNRVGNVFVTLTVIRTYGLYFASHCKLFVSGDIERYDLIL